MAALMVFAGTSFELTMLEGRRARLLIDGATAFHAADAALDACAEGLRENHLPALEPEPGRERAEPTGWRRAGIFDSALAYRPFASWPGAAAPPSCVIEAWRVAARPDARAYLVTARGVGAAPLTAVWLQLQIAFENDVVTRRWRHVAARPES